MELSNRDLLIIIAPIITLVIAIITTIYNIVERRKYYKIEEKKLVIEMSKKFLNNSSFIDDKYSIYNSLIYEIGKVTSVLIRIKTLLISPNNDNCREILKREINAEYIHKILEDTANIIRSKGSLIAYNIHKMITRDYCLFIENKIKTVNNIVESMHLNDNSDLLLIEINEMLGECEKINEYLRKDMSQTILSFIKSDYRE